VLAIHVAGDVEDFGDPFHAKQVLGRLRQVEAEVLAVVVDALGFGDQIRRDAADGFPQLEIKIVKTDLRKERSAQCVAIAEPIECGVDFRVGRSRNSDVPECDIVHQSNLRSSAQAGNVPPNVRGC
jgi:hypothetical protein